MSSSRQASSRRRCCSGRLLSPPPDGSTLACARSNSHSDGSHAQQTPARGGLTPCHPRLLLSSAEVSNASTRLAHSPAPAARQKGTRTVTLAYISARSLTCAIVVLAISHLLISPHPFTRLTRQPPSQADSTQTSASPDIAPQADTAMSAVQVSRSVVKKILAVVRTSSAIIPCSKLTSFTYRKRPRAQAPPSVARSARLSSATSRPSSCWTTCVPCSSAFRSHANHPLTRSSSSRKAQASPTTLTAA